jgi:hypothetical protein
MIDNEIDVEQKKIDEQRAARAAEFEEARLKRRADEAEALKKKQEENGLRRMQEDFLGANPEASEADFVRLLPQIKDAAMLENFKKARETMANQTFMEKLEVM